MIRTMLVLLVLVTLAAPARAQWGYPVQNVYDSGYTYVLYSSGNIVREGGWGGRVLIDNGTGTQMIAAGGGRCYVLKNNGNIWMYEGSNWRMIDNGTGTSRIWVDYGTVCCRKNSGQVWRCVDPYSMQWQQTGGRDGIRAANFEALHTGTI